jgi:hypothetical protein
MPDIAGEVLGAIIEESEAWIQEAHECPRPQVHILAENMDKPYLGYIICRRFYRGADAASAISHLGRLPSALVATRIFVVWEDRDLRTALEMPIGRPVQSLCVVDVQAGRHTMLWLPFNVLQHDSEIVVEWGRPARYDNVSLPAPIEDLIKAWHEPPDDLERTVLDMQAAGYRIRWSTAYKSRS